MKHFYTLYVLLFCLMATPAFAVQELIQTGATTPIPFLLVDSATGQNGQTGQASNITVTVCKPGTTSYVASSGTITELGNGLYNYAPTTAETGSGTTEGLLLLHITDTTDSTQIVDVSVQIVAFNPNDAAALGLSTLGTISTTVSALPSASANATAIWTAGTRTLTGTPSVNVAQIAGQTANASGAVTFPGSIGTSTYAGADTSGTTTLLARIPTFPTNFATLSIDGSGYTRLSTSDTTASTMANLTQGSAGTQKFTATALSLAPTGGSAPTTAQIAAAILATPSNLLVTNSSGYVTATNGGSGSVTDSTVQNDVTTVLSGLGITSGWVTNVATANTDVPLIYTQTAPPIYSIQAAATTTDTAETLTAKQYAQLGTSEIVGDRNFAAASGGTQTGTVYLAGYGTTYPVETITINTTTGQVVNRLIEQPFPNEP